MSNEKRVVLVVDDDRLNRRLCADLLIEEGYEVTTASDADEGLSRAWTERPDLVVMDVELPGMSGLEATRALRLDPRSQAMPVLVLTAQALSFSPEDAARAGATAFVRKPLRFPEFQETVARLLGIGGTIARALAAIALGTTLGTRAASADVRYEVPGELRLRVESVGDFALDDATRTGGQTWARHLLRISPVITSDAVDLHLRLDLQTGQSFGEVAPAGADFVERRAGEPLDRHDGWQTFLPRQAWLEARLHWTELRFGLMTSQWGLGLLENAGEPEEQVDARGHARPHALGEAWTGDHVARLALAARPFGAGSGRALSGVRLEAAADIVYEDEDANALGGDEARRVSLSAEHVGSGQALGVLGAWRTQTSESGYVASWTTAQAYLRGAHALASGGAILAAEAEFGARFEDSAGADPAFDRLAGLARVWLEDVGRSTVWATEAGYAAGLAFDPNQHVSVVLFDEVVRRVNLRLAERVDARPDVRVRTPTRTVQVDGAVHDAVYVRPSWTWRPDRWTCALGALAAWATAPWADPVETADRALESNAWAQPAAQFYGVEVDASVGYRVPFAPLRSVGVGLEGGLLLPGAALAGLGEAPVGRIEARVDVAF